jgi:hypothetical protein
VANNNFFIPWDITESATESAASVPVSSGTASKLFVRMDSALEAGETATVTVRKNGVNTALTCTVASLALVCSNTGATVTFADGDVLSVLYTEGGNPSELVSWTILYQGP